MVIRNSAGANADFAPVSQFEFGETEDACGFMSVAHAKYAGFPGKGPLGASEDVDLWADTQYDLEYGNHSASQSGGVSIDDMHRLFHSAGLHYWDMPIVDANRLRLALNAGYIIAVTVDEASVHDLDLGGACPYEWNPAPGQYSHVFLLTGPGQAGSFFLAEDTANVVGPLQGNNTVRLGPRRYNEKSLQIHWASIIQLPWLQPIPSSDPANWPTGFNAQAKPVTGNTHFDQEASDCWNSITTMLNECIAGSGVTLQPPPQNTGIFKSWQAAWANGHQFGPPLTREYHTVDMNGKPIIAQEFAHARCEWDGSAHWSTA